MLEYDFINVLRLDGCFRFLNLGYRIHLHQSTFSEKYFDALPTKIQKELIQFTEVLEGMDWEIPKFHTMREDDNAVKYYVFTNSKGEISEAKYAEMYNEEFQEFKKKIQNESI